MADPARGQPRGDHAPATACRVRLPDRDLRDIPYLADQLADLLFVRLAPANRVRGLCFAVIAGAMYWGSAGATRLTAPLSHLNLLLVAGAAAAALLLVPSSISYTGRGPWEIIDALRDQGAAYHQFQLQLYTTEGQRNIIVALRALAAPLTFAVLPLGIIHWRTMGGAGGRR